jgi:hypothetical protein
MRSNNNNNVRDAFSTSKLTTEKTLTIQNRKIPRKVKEDSKTLKKTGQEV